MAGTDEEITENRDRRLLREAHEQAFIARRQLRAELPNPSAAAKRQLAQAAADFRDKLSDYRGEQALQTPWDERDVNVDIVDQLLSQTTTVREPVDRRGNATKTVTRQLVCSSDVSPQLLIDISKELDAIYKELGFAPSARDPTPSEEADLSDLRGLLRERGQTEALEQLPGNPGEEGDDE